MPLVTSNVETVAATLTNLSASDAKGALQLTSHDDREGADVVYRHWQPTRATVGAVVVHYRAPISEVLAPRGAAPPLELRSDHSSFSGQGSTFLLLPDDQRVRPITIHWDLDRMGDHAIGVSSLGAGDITTNATAAKALGDSFFMGGDVHLYPAVPPPTGFFAAWYGNAPFDLEPVMASEQKLYSFYERFFNRPSTAPYGVFLRENLVNAGGGVSLGNSSFVTTFGPKTELDEVKITLAHEMLHTFVGSLEPPAMDDSWYSEGLAVYYARLLALRAGQITPAQFLADLNSTAGRYYTDILIHTPNSEIAKNFWADTRIRVLPYDRGSMYFAVLDGELRASSGGKQSLDDLLLAMLDRRRHNLTSDQAAWVGLLQSHLGQKGTSEFYAMLAGAIQLPLSNGFGPCFQRISMPMRRYQLGFEPRVLIEHKRVVRGLIPGSAAEAAGVRDGDEITQPVPQDILQGQQDGILTLKLLRDGKPLVISYLPRGETVDAYQWVRNGKVPDADCAF
jgi:predicted metalloprotease with PDZ domain